MNKHISMRFDFVEEHVVNIKSIATKVGAVSRGMKSCSSVLKRGNTVSDSLHRQVEVTRNNVKLINQSLIDVHITLAKVRDLYYKAEKLNYTAISGKKPYEDLNVFEKIKYYGEKVGRAVVTKIDNCITSLKDYLPGGKYWEVTKQTATLVIVSTIAIVLLSQALTLGPAVGVLKITAAIIKAKAAITPVVNQSKNWAYSMTGEYDKIEDVNWLDIGLDTVKAAKGIDDLKDYKDVIGIAKTTIEIAKETGEYLNDAFKYAIGIDPNLPSMERTGSNIFFSLLEQGVDFLDNKTGSAAVKVGKELFNYGSKLIYQN